MINLKLLVKTDSLMYPLYAMLSPVSRLLKRPDNPSVSGFSVIIKMLGIGSITRIFTTLKAHNIDLSRVYFITLDSNQELCELLKIPKVIYINSTHYYLIPLSIVRSLYRIRKAKPAYIVDFERSSNLLGIFRDIFTIFSSIKTVSFYQLQEDRAYGPDIRFTLKDRSIDDLIELSISYLPKYSGQEVNLVLPNDSQYNHETNQVFININASDYLTYRKYSREGFADIIKGLLENFPDLEISLIGSASERNYVQSMIDHYLSTGMPVRNRCGDWNLKELVEEMRRAKLLITNDSGPMHLAVTNKVKTIVIWGPTTPEVFGYVDHPEVINIQSGRACAPCFSYPKSRAGKVCDFRIDCMKDIKASQVIKAATQWLTKDTVVL